MIRPMTPADIPSVSLVDKASFPIPWGAAAYEYELDNPAAHFFVAEADGCAPQENGGQVVGLAGYWLALDEAHIGTLAVRPDFRRRGLGRALLQYLLLDAIQAGAMLATLEVRLSNQAARALYRRHGFEEVGRRRNYYRDNREDALLLTITLDEPARERLRALTAQST